MSIPIFKLEKGFDVSNSTTAELGLLGGQTCEDPLTFQANSVDELLLHTLTPNLVITSWGMGKTLQPGILAGLQGNTECMGTHSPELPVVPDKSLISGLTPQVYPSQAGRGT
jgi:hypothetical protein